MLPETKKTFEAFSVKKIILDYGRLLSNVKFISLTLIIGCFFSAYMAFITFAPFLYMKTFGLSSSFYALNQGIIVGCFAIISLFSGKILETLGTRWCIINGTIARFIGAALFVILSIVTPYSAYSATTSMVIFTIGCAICSGIIFNSAINVLSDIIGTASSAVIFIRSLMIALFIGLASYLYNGQAISLSILILLATILEVVFTIYLFRTKSIG